VRAADSISRLGGDEFAVLLAPPADARAALRATDAIERSLAVPFEIRGLPVQVAASFGIAVYPEHADSADELLQRADVAMYAAKRARTGTEGTPPSATPTRATDWRSAASCAARSRATSCGSTSSRRRTPRAAP
jgi:GGDEF domain-containing protein